MADERPWMEQVLDRYERRLVRYALRLVGDLEAARDIVQDCFLRLCRQPPHALDARLAEWLFTVCRHRAIDHLRKEGRLQPEPDFADLPAGASAPAAALEAAEAADALRQRLAALPPRQREAVRLKFEEGLSYQAIANVMATSVSNVGVLLHHAIRSLRADLVPGGAP